jgi:hypothetical protein
MKARPLAIVGVNALVLLALLLLIEAALQLVAVIRPSYHVLFLRPDRVLGWTQVPNLHWTWTGYQNFWYARDFSVEVTTSPLGFRDVARDSAKPPGTERVALLGDSFIEAVQVPYEKTGAQLLERELNRSLGRAPGTPPGERKWEVLNFGISNYGIGQYLLTWERHASKYHPDYVAVFVAKFHMQRTVNKYEYGAFPTTAGERLWVRPTFRLDRDSLVREPARDYDRFVNIQEQLIASVFAGKRMRRMPLRLHTVDYVRPVLHAMAVRCGLRKDPVPAPVDQVPDSVLYAVNLRILQDLGRQVRDAGGALVLLDVSQYVEDDPSVSSTLKRFCGEEGFGYVPLYQDLMKANKAGVPTRWAHDFHFNEAGNAILARSLFHWIAQAESTRASR